MALKHPVSLLAQLHRASAVLSKVPAKTVAQPLTAMPVATKKTAAEFSVTEKMFLVRYCETEFGTNGLQGISQAQWEDAMDGLLHARRQPGGVDEWLGLHVENEDMTSLRQYAEKIRLGTTRPRASTRSAGLRAKIADTKKTTATAGPISVYRNNKLVDHAPSFKNVAEAKRWVEDYDRGGPVRWKKETAQYSGQWMTSYIGGPGNAWEIRVLVESREAATERTARPRANTQADVLLSKIEDALSKVPDTIADTYVWRAFRDLKDNYKVSRIPQIREYLAKHGLNPQDNAITIFRDLERLRGILENDGVIVETLAPDRNRVRDAREVNEFLQRLAAGETAPLRQIVEKLNRLDFRKESQKVQAFIRDAQGIIDTLDRVVINVRG